MKNFLLNDEYILNRNRNAWIDYVKGICIILVCYRHWFEGLNSDGLLAKEYPILKFLNVYFYSFRMPLFFLLSGMLVNLLLAKKGVKNYIGDRFKTIYYPMLVWGVVQISLQLVFKEYVNADRTPQDYLNLIIMPRKIEQFWYLNTLFLVGVVYALLQQIPGMDKKKQLIVGIALYMISAWLNSIPTAAYFLTDLTHYYIFFAIGAYLTPFVLNNTLARWINDKQIWIAAILLFTSSHFLFYQINITHGVDFYVQNHMPILFILISLIGCVFVIMIGKYMEKIAFWPFLRVIGYHSLYIYLLHVMIMAAVRVLFIHFLDIHNPLLIMVVAISAGVFLPIVIYNVFSRNGAWWLFSAKKPSFLEG